VTISMPPVQVQALQAAGGAVPPPIIGYALIDSGANNTAIDHAAAARLGLRAVGNVKVNTPAGQVNQFQYIGLVTLAGQANGLWTLTSATLAPQGLVMLIGTDVLCNAVFVLDGISGTFSISFP
jgi:hypothetical protein